MSRIPFIEARFFDPAETRYALEERFEPFLRDLRSGKLRPKTALANESNGLNDDDDTLPSLDDDPVPIVKLGDGDQSRIKRRAARLLERRKSASGLDHLKKEDRDRLEVLKDGAMLITIPSEHRADELASELHAEMPWMARPPRSSGRPCAARSARAGRGCGCRPCCSTALPVLARAIGRVASARSSGRRPPSSRLPARTPALAWLAASAAEAPPARAA